MEGDFAVPGRDGSGILVLLKLLGRKGLAPGEGVASSTGPAGEAEGAG